MRFGALEGAVGTYLTAPPAPAITVVGVSIRGELFHQVIPGRPLTLDTRVHVYAASTGAGFRLWHADPSCIPHARRVTTAIRGLLNSPDRDGCGECTLTARLHFAVAAVTESDAHWVLVTCLPQLNPASVGRCAPCEVIADVAQVSDVELLELHDAPHRGLLAKVPVGGAAELDLCWDLMLSTVHHLTPDPAAPEGWERQVSGTDEHPARLAYLARHNEATEVTDLAAVDRSLLVLAAALDPRRAHGRQVSQVQQLYLDVATAVQCPAHS